MDLNKEETASVFVEVKGLPADESINTSSQDVFKTHDVAQWHDSSETRVKVEPPEEVICENLVDELCTSTKIETSDIKEENIDEDDSFDYTTYGGHFIEDMQNEQQDCNLTHTKEKKFFCDVCDKGFHVLSKLVRHNRVHTGEKPYVCDVCNKGFALSSNLARHKLIHTGEKPYACYICQRRFTQRSALITHERIHTGEKPYVCDVCNKTFTISSSLTKHKRIHYRK